MGAKDTNAFKIRVDKTNTRLLDLVFWPSVG
jgi:hypothetical protein